MVFNHVGRAATPLYYVAWFIPTLLLLTLRARWLRVWPTVGPLVVLAAIFFVAAQGPEMVGPSRFAFRFMPFFAFAVVLLAACAVTREERLPIGRRQKAIAVGAALYTVVYSLQRESGNIDLLSTGLWGAAVAALIFRNVISDARLWSFCLLVSVGFFVQTHTLWWSNANLSNWQAPVSADEYRNVRTVGPADYSMIFVGSTVSPDETFLGELGTGNTALHTGRNLVFGYTPTGHAAFNRAFCMFFFGWTCNRSVSKALEPDAATGVRLLDLMRVREVIAALPLAKSFAAQVPPEWRETTTDDGRTESRRWVRAAPVRDLPGTVSWLPEDVALSTRAPTAAESEAFDVGARSRPATIVFARMYLDGYRLTLDGKPVETSAHHGFVLAGALPAGEAGVLELRYVDPSRGWTIAFAAAGLLALLAASIALRRFSTPSTPPTSPPASPAAAHP